jgi:hypothetical protein
MRIGLELMIGVHEVDGHVGAFQEPIYVKDDDVNGNPRWMVVR